MIQSPIYVETIPNAYRQTMVLIMASDYADIDALNGEKTSIARLSIISNTALVALKLAVKSVKGLVDARLSNVHIEPCKEMGDNCKVCDGECNDG